VSLTGWRGLPPGCARARMSTVPSREQFEESISVFSRIRNICKCFPERVRFRYGPEDRLGDLTRNQVIEAVVWQLEMWGRELIPLLESTPVYQWLREQDAYQKAHAVISKKRKLRHSSPGDEAEDVADAYEECFRPRAEIEVKADFHARQRVGFFDKGISWESIRDQQMKMEACPENVRQGASRFLIQRLEHEPLEWLLGAISALDRYYNQNSVDEGTKQDAHNRAMRALAEIERLLVDVETAHTLFDDPLTNGVERMHKFIERQRDYLNRGLRRTMPVGKRDSTLRERTLVWDLRNTFLRTLGKDCATAIAHLLTLPGVKNDLDLRTVNRHLSTWRKTTKLVGWLR
jgi:hypothetical protein